ncbi:hypothetical protein [Stakelama marina]|uniref:Cadherin repeat domain-containing protein n=1 Tax=Stakelama marina TaxID=2826939 RepID=A0A8T4IHV8_9SPHN|nr:hypothetical protein [Stakelama marina]MBR0551786.1 cadherin repeat domain-containing protein [Stakelama marina]
MLRRGAASALAIGIVTLTASCGGGGGTTPTPTAANHAPAFTSAASASVVENSDGVAYTATATDADGDPVAITISGGTDANAFDLTDGDLTFVSRPDFERPDDANGDNIYNVTLTASDGKGGKTSLAVSVEVTNDHEGVNLSKIADGFGTDAVIAARTDKSGLIVISQDGSVHQVDAATGTVSDIGNVFKAGETGRVLAVADFNRYGVAMLDIASRGVIVRSVPLLDSLNQYTIDAQMAAPSTM